MYLICIIDVYSIHPVYSLDTLDTLNHIAIYSTDQMQGISLMHLLLAMNVFIADNERVYRWREARLVIEKYTITACLHYRSIRSSSNCFESVRSLECVYTSGAGSNPVRFLGVRLH